MSANSVVRSAIIIAITPTCATWGEFNKTVFNLRVLIVDTLRGRILS